MLPEALELTPLFPSAVLGLKGGKFVFFAQQSLEKRQNGLWEGLFFIAPGVSSDSLRDATEGGIPRSRYPVSG
jgi:hypothetical protein